MFYHNIFVPYTLSKFFPSKHDEKNFHYLRIHFMIIIIQSDDKNFLFSKVINKV